MKRKVNIIKTNPSYIHASWLDCVVKGELFPKRHVSVGIYFNWGSKDLVTQEVSKTLDVSYNSVAFQERNIKGHFSTRHANYATDLSSQEKQRLARSFCLEKAFIC